MSTPIYKGQTTATPTDMLAGWLGGMFGPAAPVYKTAPPPKPPTTPPPTCPPPPVCTCPPAPSCPPPPQCCLHGSKCPGPGSIQGPPLDCDAVPVPLPIERDVCGDATIPVGPGPITIVVQP